MERKPENPESAPPEQAGKDDDARKAWERPALRRLGADPAIFGGTANFYVYTS